MFNIYLGTYRDKNNDRCEMWRSSLDGEYTSIDESGFQVRLGVSLPKEYAKEDFPGGQNENPNAI